VRGTSLRLRRDDVICVLSQGVLVFCVDYAAVYWAEQRISSGLTAILFSTMPLTTALLSRFWTRRETLGVRRLVGILVGVAGTAVLFWPSERLASTEVWGMAAALLGSTSAAVSLVIVKRHGRHSDPFVLNFLGMGIGAVGLVTSSALFEPWSTVVWSTSNVTALVYLALFGSVVAFTAYYRLVKSLDATVVSLSTLVTPIVALALGHAVLGETVTTRALAGIVTILLGTSLARARRV
jgi:drug/metabolite transporter (DMT)-like permease